MTDTKIGKAITFTVSCEVSGILVSAVPDLTAADLLDFLQSGQAVVESVFMQDCLPVRDKVNKEVLGHVMQPIGSTQCEEFEDK